MWGEEKHKGSGEGKEEGKRENYTFTWYRLNISNASVNDVYVGEDTRILKHEEQDSTRQVNKHWLYKPYRDDQLSTQNWV